MYSCCLNLPDPFSWQITGIGPCIELITRLQRIMNLPPASNGSSGISVMLRSHFETLPENERTALEVFYSRRAVRLFRHVSSAQWILVLPEDVLADRSTRVVLMWLILQPFFLNCLALGALPVHAASADCDGKGILVAAAGDTGKTTTVRRLSPPWRELGDDAALLLPRRDGYELHPLPTWSEFIYGAKSSPAWSFAGETVLDGIFFLRQAKFDRADAIAGPEATMSLYGSVMEAMGPWQKQISAGLKKKIFETAANLVHSTPVFVLHATLTGDVQGSIETALRKKQKDF